MPPQLEVSAFATDFHREPVLHGSRSHGRFNVGGKAPASRARSEGTPREVSSQPVWSPIPCVPQPLWASQHPNAPCQSPKSTARLALLIMLLPGQWTRSLSQFCKASRLNKTLKKPSPILLVPFVHVAHLVLIEETTDVAPLRAKQELENLLGHAIHGGRKSSQVGPNEWDWPSLQISYHDVAGSHQW